MAKTKEEIDKLIKQKSGLRIDIGGGENPHPGFFNIDILDRKEVDLVWDVERTPWPLPDSCAITAVASHVLEHLNPHGGDKRMQPLIDLLVGKKLITLEDAESLGLPGPGFINFMNEVWRVLKPDGQFAIVVPYAESYGMFQDPTHNNFLNEATFYYFDPFHQSGYYRFYRPKPWEIVRSYAQTNGLLEIVLRKRLWDPAFEGFKDIQDITDQNVEVEDVSKYNLD